MRCSALVAFAASLLPSAPTQAADAQPPPSCELHIWAAPALRAITQSALWNQTVDQAINGPHPTPGLSAQALPPSDQLAMLEAANAGTALGIASARIVRHEQPLEERASQSPVRHDPSTSSCYAELIVSHMVYASDPLAGRSLNMLFQFRDFRDGAMPVRSFATWSHRPLAIFPARTEADGVSATAEIKSAFAGGFADFIQNMAKAQAKAGKKTNPQADHQGTKNDVAS